MYCRLLNLLYIHIPKCAGTSIQRAFEKNCRRTGKRLKKWKPHRSIIKLREKNIIKSKKPYSFTVVRNTWDRMVSVYHQEIRHKRRYDKKLYYHFIDIGFNGWVEEEGTKELDFVHNQLHYIADEQHNILVDKVLRFENLEQEFAEMLKERGIEPFPLGKHNARKDKAKYRDIYNDKSRQIIAEYYKPEIELFGYEF